LLAIRSRIDAIDVEIVRLLAQRADAIMEAVPEKRDEPPELVHERTRAVLEHVKALAAAEPTALEASFVGLVDDVYATLIRASIHRQRILYRPSELQPGRG